MKAPNTSSSRSRILYWLFILFAAGALVYIYKNLGTESTLQLATNEQHSSDRIELTTWWSSAGEQRALDVIANQFRARGGEMDLLRFEQLESMREYLRGRAAATNLPAASQWLFGDELTELIKSGSLRPVALQDDSDIYPELLNLVSRDGKLWAVPVGVHIHNSAFYNRDVYRELELDYPESWPDFIEQIPALIDGGVAPLAMSKKHWSSVYLFQSILLSVGGKSAYNTLYGRTETASPDFLSHIRRSSELFHQIREQLPAPEDKAWTKLVEEVSSGKAAMLVIGDFAHSEFMSLGDKPGIDYDCALSPGSGNNLIFGTDGFVLFDVDSRRARSAQDLLARVVLDPEVQAKYIAQKGGLPVLKSVSIESSDPCAANKIGVWADQNANRLLSLSGRIGLRGAAIRQYINQNWANGLSSQWLTQRLSTLPAYVPTPITEE